LGQSELFRDGGSGANVYQEGLGAKWAGIAHMQAVLKAQMSERKAKQKDGFDPRPRSSPLSSR
jgi:hypothetical protein